MRSVNTRSAQTAPKPQPKPICILPPATVEKSVRPDILSDFTAFLVSLFGQEKTRELTLTYMLGVTQSRDVIFFQIDRKMRCRTGKIMKYNRATGHRIKDENIGGRINWVHSIMKSRGLLPAQWELTQCLFEEHLLTEHPEKNVALVESEKTAVICSALMPEYIWLATGGKSQLNSRLDVLKQRNIIAFPNADGYDLWKQKAGAMPQLRITVSDFLQNNATDQDRADRADHADHVDILIREHLSRKAEEAAQVVSLPLGHTPSVPVGQDPMQNPNLLQVKKYFSPENHAALADLMQALDLVPSRVERLGNTPICPTCPEDNLSWDTGTAGQSQENNHPSKA